MNAGMNGKGQVTIPDGAGRRGERDLLKRLQVTYPKCGCVALAPAAKWDFGTVVGNGSQGALAFCRTSDEELVLSHEELFLPLFPDYGYLPVRQHYAHFRQLVLEGKAEAAQDLIRQLKLEGGFPGYNTTDPFVGACSLDMVMDERSDCQDYARTVNFSSGEALAAWRDASGGYHRRFFFSRADDVLVMRLCGLEGTSLSLSVGLREIAYSPPTDPKDHDIYQKTIDRCEGTVSEEMLIHHMHFKRRWESQPVNGCCTLARVVPRGGSVRVNGSRVAISGADELLLLVRTIPDRREAPVVVERELAALMQVEADYRLLLERHAAIHGELFNRCTLRLSTSAQQCQSTEWLQAQSAVGDTSPALVEKAFAAGRYGIMSSTGRLPPALQGVWTGTWKPRWSGDYTLNGNVQSMVAASLCGNHFECMEVLMDYLDSLMDDFRRNARELLGFRGPLIPWRSSTHGRTHYLAYKQYHHDFPGIYWFGGTGWFVQLYYDYYLYTGDEAFFDTRFKPFLLGAVALYEDYLSLEQDGVYVLCPSSSPENETAENVWMAPNATMTIAAIKQVLRTALRHASQLGADAGDVERWQRMLRKLPAYQMDQTGVFKEWCWPGIPNAEAHRHASHLYPLYYGVDPEIAASESLQDACRQAIENRMAFRRPENGGFMAFGLVQLGFAAAHLQETARAYEAVEYLVNSYWSPVMVSQHNTGDEPGVLNLDISGGLPGLIIELLVQALVPERDEPWTLRLLPCLPAAWPCGELRGVRCRGGFLVDVVWADGQLKEARIEALLGRPCHVLYGDRGLQLDLMRGEVVRLTGHFERME